MCTKEIMNCLFECAYGEHGNFVNALCFRVWLGNQVPVDVFEVGDSDVLLELLVQDDAVLYELDLASKIGKWGSVVMTCYHKFSFF